MERPTRKQLEKAFDEIYAKVVALLEEKNPCEVTVRNKMASCLGCHKRVCGDVIKVNELCCDNCEFHNMDKGCQAEKPLTCKFWLCWHAKQKYPEVHKQLWKMEAEAREVFGFLLFRGDKKRIIEHSIRQRG